MDLLPLLVVVVLVALLVGVLYRRLLGTVTIHEYERGVRFVRGKFVGLAGTAHRCRFSEFTYLFRVETRRNQRRPNWPRRNRVDANAPRLHQQFRKGAGERDNGAFCR